MPGLKRSFPDEIAVNVASGSTCARSSRQASVRTRASTAARRRGGRPEVAHHRDAERARVEPLRVRPDHVPVDASVAALVDRPEAVDERVVADVVPAVPLHVVQLDRPHDRGCLEPRVVVRPGRVVDERHPQGVRVHRLLLADRLVGQPAAPRHDLRDPGGRNRPQRHLRHRAAHGERPCAGHAPDRPHLEPVAAADPDGRAEAPCARLACLRACPRRARRRRPPARVASGSSRPLSGSAARADRGPASGCRRAGTARRSPPRASARRAAGAPAPAASRAPPTRRPGPRARGRRVGGGDEPCGEEAQRDAGRVLRQDARPFPDGMLTRRRTAARALLQSKST